MEGREVKKNTVLLVKWIKDHIHRTDSSESPDGYNSTRKDAEVFLDSLPEIESRLCLGGYVRDCIGTPCCDGDTIKVARFGRGPETVRLKWNSSYKAFDIIHEDGTGELLASYKFYKA